MHRLVFDAKEEDSPSLLESSTSNALRFQNGRLLLLWDDLLPAPSASLTLSFPATFWAETKTFWLGIETATSEAATTA